MFIHFLSGVRLAFRRHSILQLQTFTNGANYTSDSECAFRNSVAKSYLSTR